MLFPGVILRERGCLLASGVFVAKRPFYRPDLVRRCIVCSETDRLLEAEPSIFLLTQTRYSAAANDHAQFVPPGATKVGHHYQFPSTYYRPMVDRETYNTSQTQLSNFRPVHRSSSLGREEAFI